MWRNPICGSRGIYRLVVHSVFPAGNPSLAPLWQRGVGGIWSCAEVTDPGGCEPSCHWVPVGVFHRLSGIHSQSQEVIPPGL